MTVWNKQSGGGRSDAGRQGEAGRGGGRGRGTCLGMPCASRGQTLAGDTLA